MTAVIEARGLGKRFPLHPDRHRSLKQRLLGGLAGDAPAAGHYDALRDISFTVAKGEVLGCIGPNGAGKSTLLKLLGGIYSPTSGAVRTVGRVSTLLELGAGFCSELSGRRNIFLNASLFGYTNREIEALVPAITEFSELADWLDEPLKHYSQGMLLRLGFAIAVHLEHELLLVDEVITVGDYAFKEKGAKKIKELLGRGVTVVFASHDPQQVTRLCDRVLYLECGAAAYCGDPATALARYQSRRPE